MGVRAVKRRNVKWAMGVNPILCAGAEARRDEPEHGPAAGTVRAGAAEPNLCLLTLVAKSTVFLRWVVLELYLDGHAGSTLDNVYCKGVKRGNKLTDDKCVYMPENLAHGLRPQVCDHNIPSPDDAVRWAS